MDSILVISLVLLEKPVAWPIFIGLKENISRQNGKGIDIL